MSWTDVEAALAGAKSICWDGCHKIYILLDDEQTAQMESYGYRENDGSSDSRLYRSNEMDKATMLTTLHEWWDSSCSLRFINSVTTNHDNPNAGFTALVSQFEYVDTYRLYYTSADGPGATATWSVYSEEYPSVDDDEPIDGSTRLVEAGLPGEAAARARTEQLQREHHAT